ncbi:hypothetical protein [Endozoicomonas sp.]|uniref:hypothetical protein n=1 Tax=Endozoicomonas sp. TaxID=1892382 RepID=UPI0028865946|nr:hypothetical protein [Endozoicomonas sp.]
MSQDKAVRFENEHAKRVFSHRIVFFPSVCDGRHLIHTKCAIEILDKSKKISCPVCKKKVEPVGQVRLLLSKYSAVENECDQLHELLDWLKTGVVGRLMVVQFTERIAGLKRFVDIDPVAEKLYLMAINVFKEACVSRISKLLDSHAVGEAIKLTKGLLMHWQSDLKNELEDLWLRRCRRLEIWSKRASSDKLRYYQEVRKILRCFHENNDIKHCFRVMVFSVANSLLRCPDDYKYGDSEIICLKIARSNGCKKSGELVAKILLGKSKWVLANPTNVYLESINKAFVDMGYAQKYGSQRVKGELSTIGISFFDSLSSHRFDAMRKKASDILSLPNSNKAKIKKVLNWLDLVFWYGTQQQQWAVWHLNVTADNRITR